MTDITDIVAIDGPAGAGKSSAARRAAERLGFAFLDTGAMYRAATWNALRVGVQLDDPDALTSATKTMRLQLLDENGVTRVRVDEIDVTEAIRAPEVTRQIYRLDRCPAVRDQLVELQRAFGARRSTVAEGRDIGTVVFPNAKCKIYLDASIEERTKRRAQELAAKGIAVNLESLRSEIAERDKKDMSRDLAPLRLADDAVLLDTTSLTFEDVVNKIVQLARQRFDSTSKR